MSIPAINWCIEQKDLPPGEWVVLFHLAHCHNHETGRCDPSQTYLADMTNMGQRTVRRHLNALEAKGRISRRKRGVEGGGRVSDSYALGHEPAKLAAYLTGQSMQTNRPNGAEKVHEMAAKQEVTGSEHGIPPIAPQPSFEDFWAVVPRKVAIDKAEVAWRKAIKKAKPSDIIAGMVRYAEMRKGEDPQFTKHPATWLNGGCWKDEPPPKFTAHKPDDFHDQFSAAIGGSRNGLPSQNEIHSGASEQLPAPVRAPEPPR